MDPRLNEDAQGIRRFNDVALQGAIDRALARQEEGDAVVTVLHASTDGSTAQGEVSVVVKIDTKWSIMFAAYAKKEAGERITGGAEAEIVWKPGW